MRTSHFVLLAGLLGCGTSATTNPNPAPGTDAGASADATVAVDGGDPDAGADPCEGAFLEITLGGKTTRLTGSCTENIPFERLQ
ncbi:MAG: hypothetical protein HOO96_21215, partial [Polyangiaceae bacterium]|nr:hypothetical protein [Polyangiaceae bacterium]